jgi:hypothetical protein
LPTIREFRDRKAVFIIDVLSPNLITALLSTQRDPATISTESQGLGGQSSCLRKAVCSKFLQCKSLSFTFCSKSCVNIRLRNTDWIVGQAIALPPLSSSSTSVDHFLGVLKMSKTT